ncbi:MAG: rhodanese-like domain-containing protein [Methylococcales bacterium]
MANQIATDSAPLILDTRSRYEYDNGHVPHALYFPFWKAFFADDSLLQRCKSEPVVVYCQHGPRASFAGFALLQSGCSKVIELEGHMAGWKKQGLPVIAISDKNDKDN